MLPHKATFGSQPEFDEPVVADDDSLQRLKCYNRMLLLARFRDGSGPAMCAIRARLLLLNRKRRPAVTQQQECRGARNNIGCTSFVTSRAIFASSLCP